MHALEGTFQKLKEISIQVGLTINEHKTNATLSTANPTALGLNVVFSSLKLQRRLDT